MLFPPIKGVDILEGLDASGVILATLEGLWSQKLNDPEDSCMNLSFWMLSSQALLRINESQRRLPQWAKRTNDWRPA